MIQSLVTSLILAIVAIAPLNGYSCDPDRSICDRYREAEVAFVGTVMESSGDPWQGKGRPARVRIERIIRGLPSETAEVSVDTDLHTSGYYTLSAGMRVLVLGSWNAKQGLVISPLCAGTRPFGPEAARLIQSFSAGPNWLFGQVRLDQEKGPLAPGVLVKVRANGFAKDVRTDTYGYYSTENLPAGPYQVSFESPGWAVDSPRNPYPVATTGCTEASVRLSPDNRISGIVVDDQRRPLRGIRVETRSGTSRTTLTDDQGRFTLRHLRVGEYLIGAIPNPLRQGFHVYYPTGWDRTKATPIDMGQQTIVEGLEIRMGAQRPGMKLDLRAFWPDGTTPRGWIRFTIADRYERTEFATPDGLLQLDALEGETYDIAASADLHYATSRIVAKRGESVRLVLKPVSQTR